MSHFQGCCTLLFSGFVAAWEIVGMISVLQDFPIIGRARRSTLEVAEGEAAE